MNKIITISTVSHLYKAAVLADSIAIHGYELDIWLVADSEILLDFLLPSYCHLRWLNELPTEKIKLLVDKCPLDSDQFRWSLKPLILQHAIFEGATSVVYLDNDQYFLQSPETIIAKFYNYSILLSPHFYPDRPEIRGANWFEASFQVGVYNAGFIGVRHDATAFLNWWFNCCLYAVRKSYFRGLFDDQKYLDAVPALFQQVYSHDIPTWNFAAWNDWNIELNEVGGKLFIGNEPIVFVHFANLTLKEFAENDHLANGVYKTYIEQFKKYNPASKRIAESPISRRKILNFLRYLHWRFLTTFQD